MLSKRYGFITPSEMIGTYFKSDIMRILIVIVAIGFAIPFIAVQLSLGGIAFSVLTNNMADAGSGSVLIGTSSAGLERQRRSFCCILLNSATLGDEAFRY